MDFAGLARRAGKLAIDNSPTILTSMGVVGTITTAYLAGKASFEAADIIRLKEASDAERGESLLDAREILKDRIELVWKLYIPAVSTGAAAVAFIIAANRVGSRRMAGIVAAYTITEKTLDEYKAKVIEKIGEKKEELIRSEIAHDRMDRKPVEDIDLIDIDDGQLCFDSFSARYFKGTTEGIRSAINTVNNQINHDGVATLGDLYRELNIPPTEYSDLIGWNSDRLVEEALSTAMTQSDERAVIVLDFRNNPGPDYGRFRL